MLNDERIPNLASKLKLNSILSPSPLTKKLLKIGQIPNLARLSTVFMPKKGLNIIRFEFLGQFLNPLIIGSLLVPHLICFHICNF